MKLGLLFILVLGGAVLVAYSWIEIRINQRACQECGFRVSVDTVNERCPRCGSVIHA